MLLGSLWNQHMKCFQKYRDYIKNWFLFSFLGSLYHVLASQFHGFFMKHTVCTSALRIRTQSLSKLPKKMKIRKSAPICAQKILN